MAQTTLFAVADQTSAFLALKLSTIIWTFWLGLLYGGFFMVWLYRFGTHASMWAKSRCPLCGAAIDTIYEIPVFSWLCLGGKCHNCKAPVSWQYPFGEACCSLLFGLPALFLVWPTQTLPEMNAALKFFIFF